MSNRKTKIVKAKKVRTGDFIPGLDNAYVPTDPEPAVNRAWVLDILFHDAQGEEGHVLCDPDMPVTVERERKEKKVTPVAAHEPKWRTRGSGSIYCKTCGVDQAEHERTQPDAEIDKAVEQAKGEILGDMFTAASSLSHVMPIDLRSFSELHNYVDANYYAGLTEERSEWGLGDLNEVQERVHQWLASGQAEADWRNRNPGSRCVYCGQIIYFIRKHEVWKAVHRIGDPPLDTNEPQICNGGSSTDHPHQPLWLTLGEFRALTEHLPDEMPVTAYAPSGSELNDWLNLRMPDPETIPGADWDPSVGDNPPSLILETHDDFDTRQW